MRFLASLEKKTELNVEIPRFARNENYHGGGEKKASKKRLKKEGSELVTNCNQLKLPSSDGKFYKTEVANTNQLFRLIQSIPSPNAEPFKL